MSLTWWWGCQLKLVGILVKSYVKNLRGGGGDGGGAKMYVSLVSLLQIDNTIETYEVGCMERKA